MNCGESRQGRQKGVVVAGVLLAMIVRECFFRPFRDSIFFFFFIIKTQR